MKKKASELKVGDNIIIGDKILKIESLEISDESKQGKKKARIVAVDDKDEKIIIIRPTDYPFNVGK